MSTSISPHRASLQTDPQFQSPLSSASQSPGKQAYLQVLQQGRYGERHPFPEPSLHILSVPSKKLFLSSPHRARIERHCYWTLLDLSFRVPAKCDPPGSQRCSYEDRYPTPESSFTYSSVYPV